MPAEQAIAAVQTLIFTIRDPAERSRVEGILDARMQGRDVPSWDAMTPLMRVADLYLRGVITP